MTEEVIDVGDEDKVRVKKVTAKSQRDRELLEFKDLLNSYGGRAFVWRLIKKCGVFKTSFTGTPTTYFNEGKREIGLWVLQEQFLADPAVYQRMQNEAVERGDY